MVMFTIYGSSGRNQTYAFAVQCSDYNATAEADTKSITYSNLLTT